MSTKQKQLVQAGLILSGAALGAAGAMFIEPFVIGAGVVAAGAGAVMRYRDHEVALEAEEAENLATLSHSH